MKAHYDDILSRITEEPTWYDENGTPRFGQFHPDASPSIYSHVVVLLHIKCQACDQKFRVEMHDGIFSNIVHPRNLHYGDPPIHECSGGGGDTMNCDDLAVLEVWHRVGTEDWSRRSDLEGHIE